MPEGTVILSSRAPIGKVAVAGKEEVEQVRRNLQLKMRIMTERQLDICIMMNKAGNMKLKYLKL